MAAARARARNIFAARRPLFRAKSRKISREKSRDFARKRARRAAIFRAPARKFFSRGSVQKFAQNFTKNFPKNPRAVTAFSTTPHRGRRRAGVFGQILAKSAEGTFGLCRTAFSAPGFFGQKLSGVTAEFARIRKRLSVGVFGFWPKRPKIENGQKTLECNQFTNFDKLTPKRLRRGAKSSPLGGFWQKGPRGWGAEGTPARPLPVGDSRLAAPFQREALKKA